MFPSFAKKEEEKIRVFAGLFFTLLEKGVCASRENQKQQERRSACACLRAWKCVVVVVVVVVAVVLVLGFLLLSVFFLQLVL